MFGVTCRRAEPNSFDEQQASVSLRRTTEATNKCELEVGGVPPSLLVDEGYDDLHLGRIKTALARKLTPGRVTCAGSNHEKFSI